MASSALSLSSTQWPFAIVHVCCQTADLQVTDLNEEVDAPVLPLSYDKECRCQWYLCMCRILWWF